MKGPAQVLIHMPGVRLYFVKHKKGPPQWLKIGKDIQIIMGGGGGGSVVAKQWMEKHQRTRTDWFTSTHMFTTFMYLGLAKLGALMAGKGTLDRKKVSYTFGSFRVIDSGVNTIFFFFIKWYFAA